MLRITIFVKNSIFKNYRNLSGKELLEKVYQEVIFARASDPKINNRNAYWEKFCKKHLEKILKVFTRDQTLELAVKDINIHKFVNFACNRVDSVALSSKASQRFLKLAAELPKSLSYKNFRNNILDLALKVREEDFVYFDKKWIKNIESNLDTKLFAQLSKKEKNHLIKSGIVVADTNWQRHLHDVFFMFLVNPGSGKLEMAQYEIDRKRVTFMDQYSWFEKGHWSLPKHYLRYEEEPIINPHEMTEMYSVFLGVEDEKKVMKV